MLLKQFQAFVNNNQLINTSDKLLLAVSGGIDSMALLHLCINSSYQFGVAHVNFKLRGAAADADEALVIATCKAHQIECFTTSFDTQSYANNNKLSIQMAARELRYTYFNTLIKEHHFTKLVTAHHADDNVETFFINLLRSSGIQGLTGIPLHNESIIRPLLFATKLQIEKYAQSHQLNFNTDSSNLKDDYLRNHLRHNVIPTLNDTATNTNQQILNSIEHLNDDANLLYELHQKAIQEITTNHTNGISINISKLLQYHNAAHLLFWFLKNYGFNSHQVHDMLSDKHNESGSLFYSNTHQILRNRNEFILSPIVLKQQVSEVIIESIHQEINTPIQLKMQVLDMQNINYKTAKAKEAYIDMAKIEFPLKLRKWQTGDAMQPLGMKKQKKVSDILIDNKVDRLTKDNTYLLCNANNEIIWLIGQRVSERFKVDENSCNILYLSTI
jgi:tRNA(Ile)-lysidine synthase